MSDGYVQMQARPIERLLKPWRFQSTVPARCSFCAEWTAKSASGAWPSHCRHCDEPFTPQPLRGLPVVTMTPERVVAR